MTLMTFDKQSNDCQMAVLL